MFKPDYDNAAKDLYFALLLSPDDRRIKRALARVDARLGRVTDERHAPTIQVRKYSGNVWEGDSRLNERWKDKICIADMWQRRPKLD